MPVLRATADRNRVTGEHGSPKNEHEVILFFILLAKFHLLKAWSEIDWDYAKHDCVAG
jgi:hypothetical protein